MPVNGVDSVDLNEDDVDPGRLASAPDGGIGTSSARIDMRKKRTIKDDSHKLKGLLGIVAVLLVRGLARVSVDVSVVGEINSKSSIIDGFEEIGAAEELAEAQESKVFALV